MRAAVAVAGGGLAAAEDAHLFVQVGFGGFAGMLGENEGGVGVAAAVGLGEDGAGVVAGGRRRW